MARYDFRAQRLFVRGDLQDDADIELDQPQAHYLLNVLRMREGEPILLFNGRDGEWRAEIAETGRRHCRLRILQQTRRQEIGPDLHYLFAPLKRARFDYVLQKATELGASAIRPVLTRHTIVMRINMDRAQANVIEAAEQCGILALPDLRPPEQLDHVLATWDPARRLIYCDENAPVKDPISALDAIGEGPLAVLIGPEGGFDESERDMLAAKPYVTAISLGPRILRADTAAVAALALTQATLGDWAEFE